MRSPGPSTPLGLGLALAASLLLPGDGGGATLPPGFQESVVISGLTSPTVVQFASDGRVFIAEKSGLIKVFDNISDTTPTIFADLRTQVHNYWDRGLLGMALHPNFPATPHVYVLYTHDAAIGGTAPRWGTAGVTSDPCPTPPGPTADGCVVSGRLSRLVASGDVMTGTEQVLIEDWFQQYQTHSVGSLAFGPDGALYASAGDGASATFLDYGQDGDPINPGGDPPVPVGGVQTPPTAEGGSLRSQDLRTSGDPATLDGTVVRIDPATGAAMPGNPLFGSPDPNASRVIAYGLRNPFRMTFRPGTDEIWIGDVGAGTWEEINRIPDANDSVIDNFGWPCHYGPANHAGFDALNLTLCENLYGEPGAVTVPYDLYNHAAKVVPGEPCDTGSSAISGLAFYGGGSYPPTYNGALFFADYARDCMWVMFQGGSGQPDPAQVQTFVSDAANPVDLKIGPGGDLFYLDLTGGKLRRVQFFSANQPPTAVIQASPQNGPLPLTVNFDGSGSSDPNPGDTLSFAWDLDGDGDYDDSTSAQPTKNYGTPGNVTVRLRVTDQLAASGTTSVIISPDNTPPVVSITSPASGTSWKVGDVIAFSGTGNDAQDGTLPASALTWSLVLQHCPGGVCHVHLLQDFPGVASGSFAAPDHEYPSHLELHLTGADSDGLTDTAVLVLPPQTVALTFESVPAGLNLVVDGSAATAPFNRTVIVGSHHSVTAPSPQTVGPSSYGFVSWSDAGAASHDFVAGAAAATRIATYSALPAPWVSQDVGLPGVAGSASHAAGTFTVNASGSDIWGSSDRFHFVHRPLSGDGEIVARVASLQNTNAWAKAGVMIRESLAANSPHAIMLITPANGLNFQHRPTAGAASLTAAGPSAAAPRWVRLVRAGNTLTGFQSPDGTAWTEVGSAIIPMAAEVFIGLAVTSHKNTTLTTATFDGVTVTGGAANLAPTVSLTSPAEGATFVAPASVPMSATAADGDGSVAQVSFHSGATLLGTDTVSPYSFSWLGAAAGSYTLTARATDDDGTVTISSPVHVTVSVAGALPPPWASQDVGLPGVAGSASHAAGTFTVNASGSDIWGSSDRFHFVHRPLSGDGEIVARVASLQNTNAWAKAGVMIRATLAANSPHAIMLITPANGLNFQHRPTAGAASLTAAGPSAAAPRWVRLVRAGNTLTGFQSPDGTAWAEVGSAIIPMAAEVFIGLAVTSHKNTTLTTATFDGVLVP